MRSKTVLFACAGNQCRSPMAEGLFQKILNEAEKYKKKIQILSAGLYADKGKPPTKKTIKVLQEKGINISYKRSEVLSPKLIAKADLILTMEKYQKETILETFTSSRGKTFTLKEFAGCEDDDIDDPMGKSIDFYRKRAREIEKCLSNAKEKIFGFLT